MKTRIRQIFPDGTEREQKQRVGHDALTRPDLQMDYLRDGGRVPGTEWVVLTQDPSRSGNEKAWFENQGNRKGQVGLVVTGPKALGKKKNGARKFIFALFLLIILFIMRTTGMMASHMGASLFSVEDRFMQNRANAGKRKQGSQTGHGQGHHSKKGHEGLTMTYRNLIAIRN